MNAGRSLGRLIVFLIFALPGLLHAEPGLRVMTSIKPLQLLAVAVAGDAATVDVLLDPRLSPHDYQFRPSDQQRLQRADVVFWVGPHLETFLQDALAGLPSRILVVPFEVPRDAKDAHIWMDPVRSIAIARRMAEVFSEVAPDRRQQWYDNAERLAAALATEDQFLRHQLATVQSRRPYMVVHDAYGLFEARYGLTHTAALTNASDQAPGARNLVQIERLMEEGKIQCVIREPQPPPKVLQRLIDGRSMRVVTADALAGDIAPGPDAAVVFYQSFGRVMLGCLQP